MTSFPAPSAGVDHYALIQRALDAAAVSGGVVRLASGIFPIGSTLRLSSNVVLAGDGMGITKLVPHEYFAGPLLAVGMPLQSLDPVYRPAVESGVYDGPSPPRWAVATKGNTVAAGVGLPLQFGRMPQSQGPDLWGGDEPLTVEWYLGAGEWGENVSLFGLGDCNADPAPWLVCKVSEGFALDYAVVGTTKRSRAVIPAPGPGPWRVSVQLDFFSARVSAWVDGERVDARLEPDWPSKGLGAQKGSLLKPPDGFAPFLIGGAFRDAGLGTDRMADVTVYGLRVCRGLLYDPDAERQTLLLDPGTPVTDEIRFFSTHPKVLPPDSLVGLLPLTDQPTGRPEAAVDSPGCRCTLEFCPPQGNTACEGVELRNVSLEGRMQPALLAGQLFGLYCNRVNFGGSGSQGFGTLPLQVSYLIELNSCRFSGRDAALVSWRQMLSADRPQIDVAGRDGFRVLGGDGSWTDGRIWRVAEWTETAWRSVGHDNGAHWRIVGLNVDNEEAGKPILEAIVSAEQGPIQPGDLTIDGLSVARPAASGTLIRLIGHGVSKDGPYQAPYGIEAKRLKSAGVVPTVVEMVGGPAWVGTVDGSLLPPGPGSAAAKAAGRVVATPPVDFKGKGGEA